MSVKLWARIAQIDDPPPLNIHGPYDPAWNEWVERVAILICAEHQPPHPNPCAAAREQAREVARNRRTTPEHQALQSAREVIVAGLRDSDDDWLDVDEENMPSLDFGIAAERVLSALEEARYTVARLEQVGLEFVTDEPVYRILGEDEKEAKQ